MTDKKAKLADAQAIDYNPLEEQEREIFIGKGNGVNLRKFSRDGHSWNGRPYVYYGNKS